MPFLGIFIEQMNKSCIPLNLVNWYLCGGGIGRTNKSQVNILMMASSDKLYEFSDYYRISDLPSFACRIQREKTVVPLENNFFFLISDKYICV